MDEHCDTVSQIRKHHLNRSNIQLMLLHREPFAFVLKRFCLSRVLFRKFCRISSTNAKSYNAKFDTPIVAVESSALRTSSMQHSFVKFLLFWASKITSTSVLPSDWETTQAYINYEPPIYIISYTPLLFNCSKVKDKILITSLDTVTCMGD
jgi:hypothetical protein